MKQATRLTLTTSPPAQTGGKPPGLLALRCRGRLPSRGLRHMLTGKGLDPETGLCYYGARYLDPKTSRWLSGDPAIGEYVPVAPVDDEAKKRNQSLPGMGGIYNTINLHTYNYSLNNPIKYSDPDGSIPFMVVTGIIGAIGGAIYGGVSSYLETGEVNWGRVATGAAVGGAAGLLMGAGTAYLAAGNALAATGETMVGLGVAGSATATSGSAVTVRLSAPQIQNALQSTERIQHAARHLIDARVLPNWSKQTETVAKDLFTQVLSNASNTFNHVLGNHPVTGYMAEINGQKIVVFVYQTTNLAGQIATAVVPTAQQLTNWGL